MERLNGIIAAAAEVPVLVYYFTEFWGAIQELKQRQSGCGG